MMAHDKPVIISNSHCWPLWTHQCQPWRWLLKIRGLSFITWASGSAFEDDSNPSSLYSLWVCTYHPINSNYMPLLIGNQLKGSPVLDKPLYWMLVLKCICYIYPAQFIIFVHARINIYAGAGGDEACDWVCMLELKPHRWEASRLR